MPGYALRLYGVDFRDCLVPEECIYRLITGGNSFQRLKMKLRIDYGSASNMKPILRVYKNSSFVSCTVNQASLKGQRNAVSDVL